MRWLLLLGLLLGCGAKRAERSIDPTPPWSTRMGKEKAKMELVEALVDHGDADAALKLIAQVRSEGSKGPELEVLHGRALTRVGLYEDAEEVLVAVVEKHPRNAEAHNRLGILYMDSKRVEMAILEFETATRLEDEDPDLQNNLGFAYMTVGRSDDAIKALRKAMKLDSSLVRTRNNLGYALVAADREKEAYRVFRASTSEADARYNLGVGLEMRGETDRARKEYSEALSSDPRHSSARAALERLTKTSEPTPPTLRPNPAL